MAKNLAIAGLLLLPVPAFAGQVGASLNGLLEAQPGRVHMISDGSSGGGGQDRQREDIAIQVVDANGAVSDATCKLSNDKGEWSATAPETVTVLRSEGDLTITCVRDGNNAGILIVGAASTQIQRPRFRFEGDSDEDTDQLITVPYYNASVRLKLSGEAAVPPSQ